MDLLTSYVEAVRPYVSDAGDVVILTCASQTLTVWNAQYTDASSYYYKTYFLEFATGNKSHFEDWSVRVAHDLLRQWGHWEKYATEWVSKLERLAEAANDLASCFTGIDPGSVWYPHQANLQNYSMSAVVHVFNITSTFQQMDTNYHALSQTIQRDKKLQCSTPPWNNGSVNYEYVKYLYAFNLYLLILLCKLI